MNSLKALISSALLVCSSAWADVHEYTLDNGLKLIVKENTRAPVVVSMIWYKVGSAHESGGRTGMSHALEHMMYKGTTAFPQGEFSELIALQGGQENAFTSTDFTAYYQKLGSDNLPLSFELEADRMQNLNFSENEFVNEMNVIKEERRMRTDDNPESLTYERFVATANLAHPYRHPVIGWMDDIENLALDDLQQWYRAWYAPNNAVLVVVGDVDAEQVHQLALQYFADIPARELPIVKPQREPPSLGERYVSVTAPANVPLLFMGFNVPTLVTAEQPWQAYALDVLASVLAGSESARLPKKLIRKQQITSEVDIEYDLYSRFDSLFTLVGVPARGHNVDDVKTALLAEIKRLQTKPITEKELQRIKTLVVADKVYEEDSLFGQAMQIGILESIGLSWQTDQDYVNQIQQVTAKQVQKVAQLFLTPERMTIAELIPNSAGNAS